MGTLYFFGDSWSSEDLEISAYVKNTISYPMRVGKLLDMPVKNFSVPGSSQDHMIIQLLSSDIAEGDHAIFSVTTPSRRTIYNDNNCIEHQFIDPSRSGANEFNDQWRSSNALFVLYHYCYFKNIHPWFICTFNVTCIEEYDNLLWKEIPDHVWLLPKNQCLVEKVFDPEFFSQRNEYRNCDFQEWLDTKNPQVQQYIRPCVNHPNENGLQAIAQKVASELASKI